MDDIWEVNKLALFLAFVIPGFISLKTYELRCPAERKSSSEQLIDAIAYSSLNYALLLWAIFLVEQNKLWETHPVFYVLFYVGVILVGPVVWPLLWFKLRKTELVQRVFPAHPTGRAWDYVFEQRKQRYLVIVYFKDGQKTAGYYGGRSFASSAPEPEQIYLEKAYLINDDGTLERPLIGTEGVIAVGDIAYIELFNRDGGSDDQRTKGQGQPPRGQGREGIPAPEGAAGQPAGRIPAGEGSGGDSSHSS